jgi:uncharacterized protein (DUF1800 family)
LGKKDGDRVLEIVLDHPSTRKFLAKKLVLYFTGQRSADLEDRVATQYDDIGKMVREIVFSQEIKNSAPRLRRPFEYMCAALRYAGAATDGGKPILNYLRHMGEISYEWPLPDGYPIDADAWKTGMLPRWQFAADLGRDKISGTLVKPSAELAHTLASPEFMTA